MPEIKTDVMLAGGGGKKTNAGETIYMALGLLLGEIPNRDGINMVNTSKRSNHELLDFGCFEHLGIVWGFAGIAEDRHANIRLLAHTHD